MFDRLLIGKEIKILSALDKSLIGRTGVVVDETKNTLVVRSSPGARIRIPKRIVRLGIQESTRETVVEGKALLGTPVERIRG